MKFRKQIFKQNKKLILALIFLIVAIFSVLLSSSLATFSDDNSSDEILSGLTSGVEQALTDIDFSSLQTLLDDIDNGNMFGLNIKDKITSILSGKYFTNYSSLFTALLSIFFVDIKNFLPILLSIVGVGILSGVFSQFRPQSESLSDTIHFVLMSVVIIILLVAFKNILAVTSSTIGLISKQMSLVFPILIVLLTSIGSFSSMAIFNPMVAVLSSVVSIVFEKVLYPIFIVMFLFSILGTISKSIKLDKLEGFLSSSFKWLVGAVLTLFTGFLSIQGLSAGRYDSVSIKATKFAIKSYIPIIGSFISDGMDFLVLGSVLVKNTIGVVGILILFITIVSPVITIVVTKLGLQLCAGIVEMSGSEKIGNFLHKCSKILIYPIVIILGIAFMYVITIALIMCTANIF